MTRFEKLLAQHYGNLTFHEIGLMRASYDYCKDEIVKWLREQKGLDGFRVQYFTDQIEKEF